MGRFHKRALHYYDSMDEYVLVDVYLHGMMEEYRVKLENLSFVFFSRLGEIAGRKMNN